MVFILRSLQYKSKMPNANIPDSFSGLNLIGVVSLFGGEIALSALKYVALLRDVPLSLYFTMVLSPGLHTISLKVFKQMEDNLSSAISGGGARDDGREIVGLSLNTNFKCIGLHSGSIVPMTSILGDTLMRKRGESIATVACTRKTPQNRNLNLKVIRLGETSKANGTTYNSRVCVDHESYCYRNILLYTIPSFTVMGVVLLLSLQDYIVFYLALLNIVSNMSIAFVARGGDFGNVNVRVSDKSPRGDILIDDGAKMYLIIGKEDAIQYAFQNSVVAHPNPDNIMWKFLRILSVYMSYLIVIANIMLLPFSSVDGQIIFGCLIFLGVLQNILLSTFGRDDVLLKMAKNAFTVESIREYTFQTRSSVIAFCILESKADSVKPMRSLLPNMPVFNAWFENVIKIIRDPECIITQTPGLLGDLNSDLQDALTVRTV